MIKKKKASEEMDREILDNKNASVGNLLGEILTDFFDRDCNLINYAFNNYSEENGLYTILFPEDIIRKQKFSPSVFSDYQTEYNTEHENEIWNLISDMFSENGKYNDATSFDCFKKSLSDFGFDVQKCEIIQDNSDGQKFKNGKDIFKFSFKILEKLQ